MQKSKLILTKPDMIFNCCEHSVDDTAQFIEEDGKLCSLLRCTKCTKSFGGLSLSQDVLDYVNTADIRRYCYKDHRPKNGIYHYNRNKKSWDLKSYLIRPQPIFDVWFPLRLENGRRRLEWMHSKLHGQETDKPLEKIMKIIDVEDPKDGYIVATVPNGRLWLFPQSQANYIDYKAMMRVLKGKSCEIRYWESNVDKQELLLVDIITL